MFTPSLSLQTSVIKTSSDSDTMLWHKRLGHIPVEKLRTLSLISSKCNILTIDSCIVCTKAKQHRLPFPVSESHSIAPFDLIHVDVWGPYKNLTHDGFKYFITIVDDHSRHTWIHLLSHKSYAFTMLKAFVKFVKTQFNSVVKVIRNDNAMELGSSITCVYFFQDNDIIHHKSTPYTPQQNGIVERKHKHILETAQALYFQSGIGVSCWVECVKVAVHLINRMPSKILHDRSPYEVLHKMKPSLCWGCKVIHS